MMASFKMEIGKVKEFIHGLTKAIIKVNGWLIKWMEKEFMLTIKSSFKVTFKMTILYVL